MDIYELLGETRTPLVTSTRAVWLLPTMLWSVTSSFCVNAAV